MTEPASRATPSSVAATAHRSRPNRASRAVASAAVLDRRVAILDADEPARESAVEETGDPEARDAEMRGDLHLGHAAVEEQARDLGRERRVRAGADG